MSLHGALKPIGAVGKPDPIPGRHAIVVGVVLALFAAGLAVATPYALRPAPVSGTTSGSLARSLASPSVDPAAVTLPSPTASSGAGARVAAAPSPVPTDELGGTTVVPTPPDPPASEQPARGEDAEPPPPQEPSSPVPDDGAPGHGKGHAKNDGKSNGKGLGKDHAKNDGKSRGKGHAEGHAKGHGKDDNSNKRKAFGNGSFGMTLLAFSPGWSREG